MRSRITVDPAAERYFKWGDLVQIGGGDPVVFKKVRNGQMTVAKPVLNERQRSVMRKIIYWIDWPNRHVFQPIQWQIWEWRNKRRLKDFRATVDEIMAEKRKKGGS